MIERLYRKFGAHYILVMMLFTRILAFVGGGLVIYYVNLTLSLPPQMHRHFVLGALVVIPVAVLLTVLLALRETKELRIVLKRLRLREPIDLTLGREAGRQAVLFPGRHVFNEALLDPCVTIVPLSLFLWLLDDAPFHVLAQVAIAGFLGISAVLITTFFISERWLAPVIRDMLNRGVSIPFDELPVSRLHVRMNVCFSVTILVTALMIGALANQRAMDIVRNPQGQAEAVADLRRQTFLIMLTAGVVGVVLSRMLADSIASRSRWLLEAMKRVEAGSLSERVAPTGTDEIDTLARQFNAMVEQLDQNDQTIRDLNANLEDKVRRRTQQLSRSKRSLQRSLKKLRENDQLKTEFFSNVSHELRTPLTMILSPLERILDRQSENVPADITALLQIMRVNGHRLLKLINQLLDFSKLEAGHVRLRLAALDVNALVRELAGSAQSLADQRGIKLSAVLDPDIPVIGADEEKLDAVLSNLLSNALKFTPSGGEVRIESRRLEDAVRVDVVDSGIGLSPDDYARVFDRFVQIDGSVSREFSGTGLGLALAKELVDMHGGEIHVESEVGRGSCFWFTMPMRDAPAVKPNIPQFPTDVARYQRFADLIACDVEFPGRDQSEHFSDGGPKVLVVDDTADVRSMLRNLLSDRYRIVCAADGAEGWDAVHTEAPDLIISDVMMPNVDGYEFCRRVKQDPRTRQIPFIMLTAKADVSMKIEGLDCGVDDYLAKPFHVGELQARVRSLLRLRRLHLELDERNRELQSTLAELQSAQVQLVHSEKMNSLGQLVAGIAHEINNSINAVYNGIQPLNAKARHLERLVSSTLDAAATSCDSETRAEIEKIFGKIAQLAQVIENGAGRTTRIVGELKTFSHPGSETAESFDLNQALDMCLNLLGNQFKHRITVQRDYGQVGTIVGPSGQLNQVFMNLLSNAQQAISGTGEIFITTRRKGGWVTVGIRDTGSGIPDEIRSKIFDPFFTTKAPGAGTGLGLSLSYSIVAKLGGTIECTSRLGEGTEFLVSLPLRSQSPGESSSGDPSANEPCLVASTPTAEGAIA
jgi:signal transduction histidine kinase